jgi:hypothetical protein
MTSRSAAHAINAAKAALFSVAASSATATILMLISICVSLPLQA